MQPDSRLRESLRFGFEREGARVAACGPDDSFDAALFEEPADLVIAGGRTGDEALAALARLRRVMDDTSAPPPILHVGNGIARAQALAEGASEFLPDPVYVRDAVTVGRLLAGRKRDNPSVLSGDLADHYGLFYLVRAVSALARRGVLTLVRGMRRGELRFYDGEVTSAQVGFLHGLAALHQLLLWTEGRFELRPEDVVRRQQIPLEPAALFADAERFLSEICSVAGELSPSAIYERDADRVARIAGRIPTEVAAVLKLFDGSRTVADVVEDCQFRMFETLRVANRLWELGLIRLRLPVDRRSPTERTVRAEPMPAERESSPNQRAAGERGGSGPRAVAGAGYVVVRKPGAASAPPVPERRRRRRGRGGQAARRDERGASPGKARGQGEPPAIAAAAVPAQRQGEPIVVDWAQVMPAAVSHDLPVSPVVPSAVAAGEISLSNDMALAAAAAQASAVAELEGPAAVVAGEQMFEEPSMLQDKVSVPPPSPADTADPALAVSAPREKTRRRATDPVPSAGPPGQAGTRTAPPAAPAEPVRARSANPTPPPGPAASFTASEEAFFTRGAEPPQPPDSPESFDDLDQDYRPQSFWRRLFGSRQPPRGGGAQGPRRR